MNIKERPATAEDLLRVQEQLSKVVNNPNLSFMTCSCWKVDKTKSWKEVCAECPSVKEILARGEIGYNHHREEHLNHVIKHVKITK